jgi:outer membrane lipoprotein-sorting protein
MRVRVQLWSAILVLLASLTSAAQTISTPAQLIQAMHERYASKWYHTLTFTQQSITHKPDGTTSTEIWHEALMLPGRLRVDIGDPAAGNGMVFNNNQLYIFKDGKQADQRPYIHPLLVLGFDVYAQPADTTVQELKDLHIDMSTMHEETFDGRPTYVVGAKQGDLKTIQFWIDKERLYFVRLLEPGQKNPAVIQDIRFDDYKEVDGGGWVAEHVSIQVEGKVVFEEKYSDVKTNIPLSEKMFDPASFAASPAK